MKNPQLCRRSKTPGCTVNVNFFKLSGKKTSYLVDLPGFGYAQRNTEHHQGFSEKTVQYLAGRDRMILRHVILLLDARRALDAGRDLEALHALHDLAISHHIVLTKADLVNPADLALSIANVFIELDKRKMATCLPFLHVVSAKKTGFGVPELRDYVASFLEQ